MIDELKAAKSTEDLLRWVEEIDVFLKGPEDEFLFDDPDAPREEGVMRIEEGEYIPESRFAEVLREDSEGDAYGAIKNSLDECDLERILAAVQRGGMKSLWRKSPRSSATSTQSSITPSWSHP